MRMIGIIVGCCLGVGCWQSFADLADEVDDTLAVDLVGDDDVAEANTCSGDAVEAEVEAEGEAAIEEAGALECAAQDDCPPGDACGGYYCRRGRCVHLWLSCDDGNPCTLDGCNPDAGGCWHEREAGCEK